VLHVEAPLHAAAELDKIFAAVTVPDTCPFEDIFVRAKAAATEAYESVWWSLPGGERWFEQPRNGGVPHSSE